MSKVKDLIDSLPPHQVRLMNKLNGVIREGDEEKLAPPVEPLPPVELPKEYQYE